MRVAILILLIAYTMPCLGQARANSNKAVSQVLENTFMIKTDSGQATGFLIDLNNKEYLVTARHAFKIINKNGSQVTVKVLYDSVFKPFSGKLLFHKSSTIDIALVELRVAIKKMDPPGLTEERYLGEDCMFFGFPYGKFYTNARQYGYIPFVKRAIISAMSDSVIFLDGINNMGFSGGPVVIIEEGTQTVKIVGVISAYHAEYNSVVDSLHKKEYDSLKFYVNSGIIYCTPIKKFVNEIIADK